MMRIVKTIPHIPFYKAEGNVVLREWTEDFVDRVGNKAILTMVEFITKKGKMNIATIRVKWEK